MKSNMEQIRNHIIILLAAPIIGLLVLLAVHLLPTDVMREHVYWSLDMIEQEFTDEILVDGYRSTLTGNFTDCLMLHHAIYSNEEHSILEQVLCMFRSETYNVEGDPEGWWPGQSLKDYLEGVPQPREVEYSRYWHGYLVILKPLLLLTSFNSIRLLNSALQLLLVGYIVLELSKKMKYSTAMAYLLSLPFMFYVSTYASLSLSICFYLMNLAVLIQLKRDRQLFAGKKYGIFFLVVGICTSYFDFLTYPLITLVYPLCIFFVLHAETLMENLKKMIVYSLEWCMGYAFMWASKWVLADMMIKSDSIKDALGTVGLRTQSMENVSRAEGFLNAVSLHIQPFANWCFILLVLIFIAAAIIQLLRKGFYKPLKSIPKGLVFLLLAMYPFVWLFVIQNHSVLHWQFTCRILSATIFAGVVAINTILEGCSRRETLDEKVI